MSVNDEARRTYDRLQSAAAQGARDRLDRLAGRADEYDVRERHRSELRKSAGFNRLQAILRKTGKADVSEWAAVRADLRDDGTPDWVFFLDNPRRRYRIRPWRSEDGEPWSHQTPCVTVCDAQDCRVMWGIPAGAFTLLGFDDLLEDTEACCARLFAISDHRTPRQ